MTAECLRNEGIPIVLPFQTYVAGNREQLSTRPRRLFTPDMPILLSSSIGVTGRGESADANSAESNLICFDCRCGPRLKRTRQLAAWDRDLKPGCVCSAGPSKI